MDESQSILERLMAVIEARKADRPSGSYTAMLLDEGTGRITAKIREEAEELIEAATDTCCSSPKFVIHEAADLFYHTLVLLAACDVSLADVEMELGKRFHTSGLEEKAARKRKAESGQPR